MQDPHPTSALSPSPTRLVQPAGTLLVLVLIVLTVLIAAIILFGTAYHFDRLEAERTQQRVERMLNSAGTSLSLLLRDYAGWDASVSNVIESLDVTWADENIGVYLSGGYRLSMTLAVNRQGRTIYGMENGKRMSDARLRDIHIPDSLSRMMKRTISASPGTTEAVVGPVQFEDALYFAAAADIRPGLGGPPRPDGVTLIFLQRLDRVAAARLLDPLLLDNVDVTIRPVTDDSLDSLKLREFDIGPDDNAVGWISWRKPSPALDYLFGMYWLLGLVLVVMFVMIANALGRIQRAARREAETSNELRQLSARYRALIDALPDLVCLVTDGRVSLINKAGLTMLGLDSASEHRVTGQPFLNLVADSDRLIFHRAMQGRGRAGGGWVVLNLHAGDSGNVPVELVVLPVTREPVGEMTLVARDRRPEMAQRESLRAAEARAAVADRAKGQFLANISHELRTPLNAIIGFSEILRDELLGSLGVPQYKEYAVDIHDGGLHLLRLVNDLLDIARMDAGALELREGWVELAPLIDRSERLLRQKAAERGVPVRIDVSPPGLRVLADEMRLKQIVVNLLGNAIRFSESGQGVLIAVRLEAVSGDLLIEVADHGIGMTVDAMRIALEPFAQVEGGHNRRQPGAGLGLPLAKGYAEAHGGGLTMQSTPAVGTTVTVRLPAARVADVPVDSQ